MNNVPRRDFISTAAAATLSLATVRTATAQTETTIQIVTVPADVSAQPYYAEDQGFFKKAGLAAEISVLGNGAEVIAALVGGQIQFGAGGTPSIAAAHERGIPIVIVAPAGSYSVTRRTHGLVVRSDSPMRSPHDIVGKTIGGAGVKTLGDVCLQAWMAKNGIDPSSVKQIEMTYAAQTAALFGGRIDGASLEEPYLSTALAQGGRIFANVFDAIAPQWVEGAFFCTYDYAKANADIVRKFADAMAQAAVWANRNPAEAWNVLDKYAKTTTAPGAQHVLYTTKLQASDFQPLIDASAKYGVLQKSIPAKDLFAPGLGS